MLATMLGEQAVIVLEVKPFGLHGLTYYDVTVGFPDRTVEDARLGPEEVPERLQSSMVRSGGQPRRPGDELPDTRLHAYSSLCTLQVVRAIAPPPPD